MTECNKMQYPIFIVNRVEWFFILPCRKVYTLCFFSPILSVQWVEREAWWGYNARLVPLMWNSLG